MPHRRDSVFIAQMVEVAEAALEFVFFIAGAGAALSLACRQKSTKSDERQSELLK